MFELFLLMILRPPSSTRTDTLFPYAALVLSDEVNVILIICLEVGRLEGHVEHVRRSDYQFHIDALDVSLRGVGREGRGRNSREQNESLDVLVVVVEQVDIGPELPAADLPS